MPRRILIAGNWKMNGSLAALQELDGIADAASRRSDRDIVICPPATLISPAAARQPALSIGGQDCHWHASGAHTGCLSPAMLKEAGATYVIVGHSERRTDNHETSHEVKMKAESAITAGLTAIVCVGETEPQRDAGEAISIVTRQIAESVPTADATQLVVAYEPVWAIGTGRTPSINDVDEMHRAIRSQLVSQLGDETGNAVRILYGGSVKPSNAGELLSVPDVDGALVGGASLKAVDFTAIVNS